MAEMVVASELLVPFEMLVLPPQPTYTVPRHAPGGIHYANAEISQWFGGKVEDKTEEVELICKRLSSCKFVCENEISLNLSEAPALTVSQIIALLYRHLANLSSPLLLTGWPNVFHAVDKFDTRRTIQARWFPGYCGWELRAHELGGCRPIYRHAHIVMPLAKGPP